MKFLSVFLFCLLVLSCHRLPDVSVGNFDYTVVDSPSFSLPANDYGVFKTSVNVVSGNANGQVITLNFVGLPTNVTAVKNNFSFYPNTDINDTFIAKNATPGTYPVQAVYSNSTVTTKTYKFNLIVKPPLNRVAELADYYYPSNTCANTKFISCTIDSVPGAPGRVIFIDQIDIRAYDTAYGIVDCCSNTFTIPVQKVQGNTVSGYGTFSGGLRPYRTALVTKQIVTDTATYNCTFTLSQ